MTYTRPPREGLTTLKGVHFAQIKLKETLEGAARKRRELVGHHTQKA